MKKVNFTIKYFTRLLLLAVFAVFSVSASYASSNSEESFDPGSMILHHVADAHEWHFATIGHTHVTLPLPVIVYSGDKGVEVFSSANFHNDTRTFGDYKLDDHDHLVSLSGRSFSDLSITKNVASLFISVILLFGVFLTVAGSYKKNPKGAPKGVQSFMEPIIVFIRDEVAKPNIGPKYEKFLPYLLTVFFFIWFNNLLGLMPGGANLTGNISVTFVLAIITFIITNINGNKDYWAHIYNTPGVPWWLKFGIPLMPVVEFIGLFTKPISLMIRLFANITAGHIIILSLFSLIFIFQSYAIGFASSIFVVLMMFMELLVAIIQAYVFTLLSSMYFGSAVAEHHHEEGHGDHH
jgi:F-type H+-transporting ATPase subunit a